MTIQIFQPSLGELEAEAVRRVMKSNWIGRGKVCQDFERKFAEHLNVPAENLISITSCTDGLFLAMDLLGVGEGDLVILPTISFIGAANAVSALGGRPLFCDVDERTLNVTAEDIAACLTSYPYVRKARFKAVIPLHYGGSPCADIEDILLFCNEHNIAVVEDSACSVSSKVDQHFSCGTLGEVGVWSFDAMKILSTGDGGMIYVRNPEDRYRLEKRAFLGLTSSSGLSADPNSQWWGVDIDVPGRRCLMNDLTASIGLVQLDRLPVFIQARKVIHDLYMQRLAGIEGLRLPPPLPEGHSSSYYLFWVQLEDERKRDGLARFLRSNDIYTTFRYYPLHWVRYYAERYPMPRLPKAEKAASTTLCLPIHQSMSFGDVEKVCEQVYLYMNFRRIGGSA